MILSTPDHTARPVLKRRPIKPAPPGTFAPKPSPAAIVAPQPEDSQAKKRSTLLLQSEVAMRMRCSEAAVKRLRLAGLLPYLPGRPVRIIEAHLRRYVEDLRRSQLERVPAAAAGDERDVASKARDRFLRNARRRALRAGT